MRKNIWKEVMLKLISLFGIIFLLFLSTTVKPTNLDEEVYKQKIINFIEEQVDNGYVEKSQTNFSSPDAVYEGFLLKTWDIDENFKGMEYLRFDDEYIVIYLVYHDEAWYVEDIYFNGFVYEFYSVEGYVDDVEVLKEGLKEIMSEDLEFLQEIGREA